MAKGPCSEFCRVSWHWFFALLLDFDRLWIGICGRFGRQTWKHTMLPWLLLFLTSCSLRLSLFATLMPAFKSAVILVCRFFTFCFLRWLLVCRFFTFCFLRWLSLRLRRLARSGSRSVRSLGRRWIYPSLTSCLLSCSPLFQLCRLSLRNFFVV